MAKKLGEILVGAGTISAEDLNRALERQKEDKKRLGEIIVEMNLASEVDIVHTLSVELGIPYAELSKTVIDPVAVELVPESLARKHNLLPLNIEDKILTIAMLDPLDFKAIDDVRFRSEKKIRPMVTTKSELLEAMNLHYNSAQSISDIIVSDLSNSTTQVEVVYDREGVDLEALKKKSETPPIIRMVNLMIADAIRSRSSDIHLEPQERRLLVRERVDGILRNALELPKWVQGAVVSRIKIMAKMDIAEKRLPQDGRVKLRVDGKEIDMRISTLPTQYGESVVIRLLESKGSGINLDNLGMMSQELKKVVSFISKPQGVVLITGPTGSGKSSTLYAFLNYIKKEMINIITLEDPIEYEIEGLNQVMIDERVGLTFANGLRSILRQDPDVIMVGEMRDHETAEIAMQASLTGHLVLSTLHTNDSIGSIMRLLDLNVKPFLIASSINGVIAQRLVRVICRHCMEAYVPTTDDLIYINIDEESLPHLKFYRGKGCDQCGNTGYSGRTGVYELFQISTRIREMIASRASENMIRQAAVAEGMITLQEAALEKVKMGITTIDEVRRVIYTQGDSSATICSSCGKILSEDFTVCPYCSHSVETICPSCGRHRAHNWIVCPYCRTSLKGGAGVLVQ